MYLYFSRHLERPGNFQNIKVGRSSTTRSCCLVSRADCLQTCIERAEGGVLFVDEAYRLKVDSEKDYLDGSHAPR